MHQLCGIVDLGELSTITAGSLMAGTPITVVKRPIIWSGP